MDGPHRLGQPMSAVDRFIWNAVVSILTRSRDFYRNLFDLEVVYDSDWFAVLHGGAGRIEIGLLKAGHSVSPSDISPGQPDSTYPTFVVPDVDEAAKKATELGAIVVEQPRDLFYANGCGKPGGGGARRRIGGSLLSATSPHRQVATACR